MEPDFSGWATKAGLKCADGRTIMKDAFAHQNNETVPLVWQHGSHTPENVLGHAVLENRPEGVYTHCYFNDTPAGQVAKRLVQHGDIKKLSIWANQLVERAKNVFHGSIKEVSLVLAGANPGAVIENVRLAHSDDPNDVTVLEDEVIIHTGSDIEGVVVVDDEDLEHDDDSTLQEIYESLNEEQKSLVHYMIGAAIENAGSLAQSDEEGENLSHQEGQTTVTHNVFEQGSATGGSTTQPQISHALMKKVFSDAKRLGSFKEAYLQHAEELGLQHAEGDYGITNIEVLFPEARNVQDRPEWITRKMGWVNSVLDGARKLPFARIKSRSADLTHEDARAKGYIKGNMKKEQYFAIASRETTPGTIYKKQKVDRDDLIDITEFDVVAWFWEEMRFMWREEAARAVLIGDGREIDDEDKIDETKIRPIARDDSFYTDVILVDSNIVGEGLIEAVVRARGRYKGVGNPTMYTTEDILADLLLIKDKQGRRMYSTQNDLQAALRVSDIVPVDVLEDAMTDDGDLLAIFVNMSDYSIGTNRGGEMTSFDDFDIDYNQYKYLIEGRFSGALTKHKTAQVLVRASGTLVTPSVPTFNATTGVVTIPSVTGVTYKNQETDATLTAGAQTAIASGATISVVAVPNTGYHFPHNFDADWDFTRD